MKSSRLSYDLFYYAIGIVFSILLWYFSFNLLHYPKSYESLYLFYAGEVNDYSFNQDAKDGLNIDGLVDVEISSANPNDSAFASKYNVVCFTKCDLALLPINIINETDCSSCFIELNNNYGLTYYSQQGINYGLILNDELKSNLSKYFAFEDKDYVITLVSSGVNHGDKTNNAYNLLEWIVNYETI